MPAHRNFFVTNTVDGHCIPMVKYTQRTQRGFAPHSREEGDSRMWMLIYAMLGLVYVPVSYAAILFGAPYRALCTVLILCNILVSFCMYFYYDYRKEQAKNKWCKFVLGNLLTVAVFCAVSFLVLLFATSGTWNEPM